MTEASLDQVVQLNDELRALSQAGIPLELGNSPAAVARTLDKIDNSLSLRSQLGQDVFAALEDSKELPSNYRAAVQAGLLSNDWSVACDALNNGAQAETDLKQSLSRSLVLPLFLVVLAYMGLIVVCQSFSPTVDALYEQTREPLSAPAAVLHFAHQWMRVWVPAVPVLLLVAWFYWRHRRNLPLRRLFGSQRYLTSTEKATFAEQLASLIEHNVEFPDAIRIASGITGDVCFVETTARTRNAADTQAAGVSGTEVKGQSPSSFLQWVLSGAVPREDLPNMLRFAAALYRQKAQEQAKYWHFAVPVLVGALLGGAIVLLYGLSVFGTMGQLLHDLAY